MSARLADGVARMSRRRSTREDAIVLGLHQTTGRDASREHGGGGRIAVFGDSRCEGGALFDCLRSRLYDCGIYFTFNWVDLVVLCIGAQIFDIRV